MAIVGQEPVMRATLFTRVAERQWQSSELFDTIAPRLEGFVEPSRFKF
jgi:protein-L-isoaspartate(D-aspartate) O-methyltransferase